MELPYSTVQLAYSSVQNQSLQRVSATVIVHWISAAANITFLVITLETAGIETVKVQCDNIPDTLLPEIHVIMAILLKCVAVCFGLSPEG